ncbi:MAG TPA: hypothetical protein VF857_04230 [Spirochaetota bacterium]
MIKSFTFLLTLLIVLPSGLWAKERILVLGTSSTELSEIDERILREETMRLFLNAGFDIVPVMEVEREVQERGTILALLNEKEIFPLGTKLSAQWAVRCVLATQKSKRSSILYVYNTATLKRYSTQIAAPAGDFPEVIPSLASLITEKAEELIKDGQRTSQK